jgi:phage major head subunit gpT-like protein
LQTKLEGQSINYSSMTEGHKGTFTHVDYALGMRATREMMRDELYGVMEDMAIELAYSANATEETILANHFNNGFSSSYTGPDGIELFSAVHVREDGGTYRNEPSSHADLSKTSLETGLIDFRKNFVDGAGKKLAIRPKYLLVSPDSQFTAARLLDSSGNPTVNYGGSGDSESAVNPINGLGLQLVVWDYLTDTNAWFLLAEKANHKLLCYTREEFNTDYIYDFDTKDYKISGQFAQSSGWGDPRGIYGTSGSS